MDLAHERQLVCEVARAGQGVKTTLVFSCELTVTLGFSCELIVTGSNTKAGGDGSCVHNLCGLCGGVMDLPVINVCSCMTRSWGGQEGNVGFQ